MKKTILITLLALLGLTQAAAQEYEYVPFVREGVKWVCDHPYTEWGYTNHRYFNLELTGDTVIDNKQYKAMHKFSGDAIDEMNDTVLVYLREENKVVYGIVPDGKTYTEFPIGMNRRPETIEMVQSGQEFILYNFNNPIDFIKDNIDDDVFIIPDMIVVNENKVNRYIFDIFDGRCIIEGIGCDGIYGGYPLSTINRILYYVIEEGDTIYTGKRLERNDWPIDDRELPIPRQGVQWVNERVIVEDGDTTQYYYKYEFSGSDSQGFALCYSYTGENLSSSSNARVVAQYQSWDYGLETSNGMIRHNLPFNKVFREGRNMVNYYSGMGDDYWEMYYFDNYATDIEYGYTPNWYIYRQKDNFLTRMNLVEVAPLVIEGIECHRYAYISEQGDTLAYIVQGLGFDSRDLGDLLTPFTRKPDPNADYQEWCGLSHVIKNGQIIYKGMRYRDGAADGIDEVVTDMTNRVLDPNYYNLMGQPVGKEVPTTPGIYIHHGKKIVIR